MEQSSGGAGSERPGDAGSETEAERVYREYREAAAAGQDPDFASLCAEHPALAEELEQLHVLRALPRPPTEAPPLSVWDRLRDEFGERAGGVVSLQAEPASKDDEAYDRVLERFTPRKEAYGRYRIGGEIASGGQGAVLEVWDEDLRRNLAMKVVHGRHSSHEGEGSTVDPRSLTRFLEEAQITGQLEHPGVVPVHELGLDPEGRVFFTMKRVHGRDLAVVFELLRKGEEGWTLTRAIGVMLKVCEAMAYAHDKGVIHRDLKPANVMVGNFGEVYVMDWGLARVLTEQDSQDLFVRTDRRDLTDSPLTTMEGDVVGTPVYMSPEQARGKLGSMGPWSDVYSVGAMLYQVITGQMPFVGSDETPDSWEVLQRVLKGKLKPADELARHVPAELVAICEKAMSRRPADRYHDMQELAVDLRAYQEGHVVRAYETGAFAEFKKWCRRNKGVAALSVTVAVVLIVSVVVSMNLRAVAVTERANVLRLSAIQELEALIAEAAQLWPATPERAQDYRDWLDEAGELVAGLHPSEDSIGHYAQLERLRAGAIELSYDEVLQVRSSHPDHPRLVELEKELAAHRYAHEVRTGVREPETFDLSPVTLSLDWQELNERAWLYIEPERTSYWGREAEGLALAREALRRTPEEEPLRFQVGDTLAWALFANGLDDDALAASRAALAAAAQEDRESASLNLSLLQLAVEDARGSQGAADLAALQEESDALEGELRLTFDEQNAWWYEQLTELVQGLERFSHPRSGLIEGSSEEWGWGIERRLAFANEVEELSVVTEEARAAWILATQSISDPDACPAYGGLEIEPQLGLLPLGRDPASGLWEFAHLQSGEVPTRSDQGGLVITPESCIVLVLLPGGTFEMGTSLPEAHDRVREHERPARSVTLDPFFLSKYELTQAQWRRIAVSNPSYFQIGSLYDGNLVVERNPVENVSWVEGAEMLRQYDLSLPTEAQWEYAVRAGTTTFFQLGDLEGEGELELLGTIANIGQDAALPESHWRSRCELGGVDGYTSTAPVGSFPANPFGLHDMLGNVQEWCRDWYDEYKYEVRPGDGEQLNDYRLNRVARGGHIQTGALLLQSAVRWKELPDTRFPHLGLRPARALR
jgi:formylglycine-generating enzyme required for sulfatase activity